MNRNSFKRLREPENNLNIDDIVFTIHAHQNSNGPQNLISFIPRTNSDKVKLSKRTTNSPTFAVSEILAESYTKRTGIKFIPFTNSISSTTVRTMHKLDLVPISIANYITSSKIYI